MTGPFHRLLSHLRGVAETGQPGRRDEVLVNRRALQELLRDYDRLDQQAREQHRKDYPDAYPP